MMGNTNDNPDRLGRGGEAWRHVWRKGLAPTLTDDNLEALRKALAEDDARLVQGATTQPPPLMCVQDWPVEAACLIGVCGWLGDGLQTVAEVEEFFAKTCFKIDERMGEPAACRWLLNWYDDTPRDEMRRELLAEVNFEIGNRERGIVGQEVAPNAVVRSEE